MLSTWIRSLLLNLLKKDEPVDEYCCSECKSKDGYFLINSVVYCSTLCYMNKKVLVPKVKKVITKKKKKGKKKK